MPEFLFVNPGNKSRAGHKISASGRAFVIRKARAANPWSTKSSKLKDGGAGASDEGDRGPIEVLNQTTAEGPTLPNTTYYPPSRVLKKQRKQVGSAAVAANKTRRGRVGAAGGAVEPVVCEEGQASDPTMNGTRPQREVTGKSRVPANNQQGLELSLQQTQCAICERALGACACRSGANLVSTARHLSGRLDPFGSLAVSMNERDTTLLAYCKFFFFFFFFFLFVLFPKME